jgi:hypothetical protein
VTGDIATELPKLKDYDFDSINIQSQENYLTNSRVKMERLKMDSCRILNMINAYIKRIRKLKYGDFDERIVYYCKRLKEQNFELVESELKYTFLTPKFPISLKILTNENNQGLK